MNHDVNPYTKFHNKIMEKLMSSKLNGTQFSIVLTVVRYTYGFHRVDHQLSASFIAAATDHNRVHVNREVNKLIDMNILLKRKESTRNRGRYLSINENIDQWRLNDS
jgi:phage replication O-like protein O